MIRPRSLTTNATKTIGIEHPIVQGPFGGGLSSVKLVAAVSNRGGMGSFGAVDLPPDKIVETAEEIRKLTDAPFNLNLWISKFDTGGDGLSEADADRYWSVFQPYFEEMGLQRPDFRGRTPLTFDAQMEGLFAARPRVFSFVFGIPDKKILAECRRLDIVTLGTATTINEAEALEAAGVDMIVATGSEAGGHRVAFLGEAEDQLIGTFALVQLVTRRVRCPVIAAGGIVDASGVRASIELGAQGAQLGTAFLACAESGTSDVHRNMLFSPSTRRTTLTRAFTGRLARSLENRWTEEMQSRTDDLAPYPVQAWYFSQLKSACLEQGRIDLFSPYGGQVAPNLVHRRADDLMDELIAGIT